ncbi:MAG: MarR family transcriptional regulator [Faecousia sp.]
MNNHSEVAKLAYELTYHRYLLNKDMAHDLFTELTVSDYIALHSIAGIASDQPAAPERTYLKDLADQLEMPIHSASSMVRKLKERGLVLWSHTGDGSDGTYVIITDSGIQAMQRQEKILNDYYSRVIEKYGYDNLVYLLKQIDHLENVMDEAFTKEGE